MKLADLSTGPDWVVYVGFIIFAVLSIVLISGHGSWLISDIIQLQKKKRQNIMKKTMQNNGNWNVCYSNSSINYGSV